MTDLVKNDQGQISGAKLVLLLACALTSVWLLRDLVDGRDLTEWHTSLLGVLLLVGLLNRFRGNIWFRIKFKDWEVESNNHGPKHQD